ncbi:MULTISPECIES: septal ring lytic transglycosylase RlpA family protein [unclassified Neptuniibacter]|jgi:rare lipoprotein A|uniref:septal ring lytic transglycosylase RlpA family protein n=1 Tax=unclassified Neptuniibacter TaxID=2630693 RepID=UPI0026E3FFCC|nr:MULTISPECIES: septal ring lytic transglycosylase RlpA family protein [unclassified Neptuniibacter]MDO6514800.1 septal ring lytic transglycosylase RlpA family protein [Neptuniibacter sp. 2_MG-2023]MDO6593330.1 septal ring lytic transglycosylase RlpA family protein [Neptuniibacter sp. 1_MG-2023]
MYNRLFVFSLIVLLAGCSSTSENSGRYSMKHDKAPDAPVDVSHVKDAVPQVEPKSRGGNKSPYTVLGKQYYVMPSANGYTATGTASWYGRKFHGHQTSNGEVYDMYKMSAAHKSLPLPTYLRVTNLANGRQVIVRVNDRGPFHDDRLIDLSYAAASKLDMLSKGTAHVKIEALDPRAWQNSENLISSPVVNHQVSVAGRYLQVGAYSSRASAEYVESQLRPILTDLAVIIRPLTNQQGTVLHRVQIGPLKSTTSLADLTQKVEQMGYATPHLVDFP